MQRRSFLALACVLLFALGCQPETAPPDVAAETAAIESLLTQQVADWNTGNIRGFMEGYWQSDSLRFASGGTVQHGWQTTLDRYLRSYPNTDAMGHLTFSDLDVRLLDASWAVALGRWHLRRSGDYEDIGGLFTLLLEQRPEGWRIVHDHTSSES